MKPKEIIVKTLPKFTKEKYFELYSFLLNEQLKDIKPKVEAKKLESEIIEKKKKDIPYFWKTFIYNLNEKDSEFEYMHISGLSLLIVRYLRLKVKMLFIRMKKLGKMIKKPIDYVVKAHLEGCKFDIELRKRLIIEKINQNMLKTKNGLKVRKNEELRGKTLPKLEMNYDDEEEKKPKKSILNLFIGKIDMKSLKQKGQWIRLKKSENLNTFIFGNHLSTKSNQGQVRKSRYIPKKERKRESTEVFESKLFEKKKKLRRHVYSSVFFNPSLTEGNENLKKRKEIRNTNSNYNTPRTKEPDIKEWFTMTNQKKIKGTYKTPNKKKYKNLRIDCEYDLKLKDYLTKEDLYF